MKTLILGASGATGQLLVRGSLAQGHQVTAFVRNPASMGGPHDGVRVVQGDVLQRDQVHAALAGQDAVLVALGVRGTGPTTVLSQAATHIVGGMERLGVSRLIVQTAMGVGDSRARSGLLYRFVIRPLFLRNMHEDHERAEAIIMASRLRWTIVRPTRLTNGAAGPYRAGVELGANALSMITRADVASFMLQQLTNDAFIEKAPSVTR